MDVFGTKTELGQILNPGIIVTCAMMLNTLYIIQKEYKQQGQKTREGRKHNIVTIVKMNNDHLII